MKLTKAERAILQHRLDVLDAIADTLDEEVRAMTKVTLLRGPIPAKVYEDATAERAARRASSLAILHSAQARQDECGDWLVDASRNYARRDV